MVQSNETDVGRLSRAATDEALRHILERVGADPEHLEAVVRDSPEALIAFTADRVIVCANAAAERLFGYGPRELDGLSTDEVVAPRLRQPRAPPMAVTADVLTVDLPGVRRDGSEFPVSWTFGCAATAAEPIFVLMARDKSELDRAVDALRVSEERFRLIVEGVSDHAILLLDPTGNVTTWNAGALKIKGYEADEIIGKSFTTFYPPEDQAAGKPRMVLERAAREGRFEDEGWRVRKDGSRFWANVVVSALRNPEGTLTGFVKVTRDLTTKRAAQENERRLLQERVAREAADAERQRFQRALMQAPFPVAMLRGTDHTIDVVNRMMLDVWRRGPEIVGSPLLHAVPELATQRVPQRLDAVFRSGKPYVGREEVLRIASTAGGNVEERFFNLEYAPLLCATGSVEGVLLCAFEVTAQVRSRNEAEAANRAKDEFLATMSHELRTPLNSILGWAKLLRQAPPDPEKVTRGLEVIERNAVAQERLIGDLLDVSRIISGKLKLSPARVAVWDIVHAAADVVRPAADAKGVRLLIDVDPELPALVVDPARLQQVMWNLLINSVKFTDRGGLITVTGERAGSLLSLRVADTGAGIAPTDLPHVFERFRQADSSMSRKHGGLGLGLAIVRHIIEAHGGSVEARSEGVGSGATFEVLLPIQAVDTSAGPRIEEKEPTPKLRPASANLANVRVLVVEDDRDSLELVRAVLEEAGARVTAAQSAQEALSVGGRFDVIVSDIGMPEMDGYAMMKRIRSRETGGTTPALALTAYARGEDALKAIRAGYQEHLAKPVDPATLVEAVSRWTLSTRP